MKFTIPSTIFRICKLVVSLYNLKDDTTEPKIYKRFFEMGRNLIEKLSASQPIMGVKLYL